MSEKPPLRLIVCGGRDYANAEFVNATLDHVLESRGIACIIEGGAKGADRLARAWAASRGVSVETFNADWKKHGAPAAGPIRNKQMIVEGKPHGVIAFPGDRGTANMIAQAEGYGLKVWLL